MISQKLSTYPASVKDLFIQIRFLIYEVDDKVEEKLWAKLPSYYRGDKFIRLIPFKNHINIEASSIKNHRELFTEYEITPKGMLKAFLNQDLPVDELKKVFSLTILNI
ncbi:MAG: DUF5655 domain-containing protein [Bacilli bacterium]|nr:DUF5655 domain-containing protein [Bacilli bacterium]